MIADVKGLKIVVDGRFDSDKNKLTQALLDRGAKVVSYTRNVDLIIAGTHCLYLDQAYKYGIPVWNEGEALAFLQGERPELDSLLPSGANLSQARVLGREGQLTIADGPGEFVCHWKRVDFRLDRKTGEDHAYALLVHPQYLGRFTLDGEPLTVTGEVFSRTLFDRLGNDFDSGRQEFGGEQGLNVTSLVRMLMQRKPGTWSWQGSRLELESEELKFGRYNNVQSFESYDIDASARTVAYQHHYSVTDLMRGE